MIYKVLQGRDGCKKDSYMAADMDKNNEVKNYGASIYDRMLVVFFAGSFFDKLKQGASSGVLKIV